MITIYQIYCKNPEITDIYIGSTKDIKSRIAEHKYACYDTEHIKYRTPLYKFIRENGGFENWDYKVLNEVEYIDDIWRRKQEQCYIDCYKPSLNTHRAYISRGDMQEKHKKHRREYYSANKETLNENHKIYYETNKEQILSQAKEYRRTNKKNIKACRKKYYEENKEMVKKKRMEYYEKNKDLILEKMKVKYEKNKVPK